MCYKIKRYVAVLIAAILIILSYIFALASSTVAFANDSKENDVIKSVNIKSPYAILMDADSGNILYSQGENERIYPASTSKILTAIVAIENSDPTDQVTVSQNALKGQENNGAHVGLKAGEVMSMNDALYAMMLDSANDAAIAIAESISGSEEEFAKLLNKKAKELKLENSHFVTPNGLFDEEHYTTVKDLALITKYAMKNEEFMEIFSAYKHIMEPTNMRSNPLDIYTSHKMTIYKSMEYEGVIGGKTGYIEESKCNVVTAAERNDIKLLCVTAKCDSIIDSYNDTAALFDAGFTNYMSAEVSPSSSQKSFQNMIENGDYAMRHSSAESEKIKVVIPKTADNKDISFKTTKVKTSFPIKEGSTTGKIQAVYNGNVVGTMDIIADKDMSFLGFIFLSAIKIIAYILIILTVAVVVLRIYFTQKKQKRRKFTKKHKTMGRA